MGLWQDTEFSAFAFIPLMHFGKYGCYKIACVVTVVSAMLVTVLWISGQPIQNAECNLYKNLSLDIKVWFNPKLQVHFGNNCGTCL